MGDARARILGDIRRSLGRDALSRDACAELERKIRAHKSNLVPRRANLSHNQQVALFVEMAESAATTVDRVKSWNEVPGAIADYLAEHNLATEFVGAPDPRLDDIPWQTRPMLRLRRGPAEDGDAVSVTSALAGIAETGTLMLLSGPETPTTLNFMPEDHIVVLGQGEVVGTFEQAWERLRRQARRGRKWAMPRTVNMITGPSRSGDIGQELHLGAHGPKRLHIVLVDERVDGQDG